MGTRKKKNEFWVLVSRSLPAWPFQSPWTFLSLGCLTYEVGIIMPGQFPPYGPICEGESVTWGEKWAACKSRVCWQVSVVPGVGEVT